MEEEVEQAMELEGKEAIQCDTFDMANDALAIAAAGYDPQALEQAIELAREAGVCAETLAQATEALETIEELAKARADATESLSRATKGDHIPMLEASIALAEEADVDEGALGAARARLHDLVSEMQRRSRGG